MEILLALLLLAFALGWFHTAYDLAASRLRYEYRRRV